MSRAYQLDDSEVIGWQIYSVDRPTTTQHSSQNFVISTFYLATTRLRYICYGKTYTFKTNRVLGKLSPLLARFFG